MPHWARVWAWGVDACYSPGTRHAASEHVMFRGSKMAHRINLKGVPLKGTPLFKLGTPLVGGGQPPLPPLPPPLPLLAVVSCYRCYS